MIRRAVPSDAVRIAEIEVFNYRLNFYPIFKNDDYYFAHLRTDTVTSEYVKDTDSFFVYDDGAVKGFMRISGEEIKKLFVEPVLQNNGIGSALMDYAVNELGCKCLWALEKNEGAVRFYERFGFYATGERKPEEDTDEYLIFMKKV